MKVNPKITDISITGKNNVSSGASAGNPSFNLTDRFTASDKDGSEIKATIKSFEDVLFGGKTQKAHVRWTYEGNKGFSQAPVASPDGKRLFANDYNTLYCVDKNGKEVWTKPLESWSCSRPVPGADGSVVIYDKGKQLKCFDNKGEIRWKKEYDATIDSSPSASPDGTLFINVTRTGEDKNKQHFCNRSLLAINPEDGGVKWEKPLKFRASPSPVFGPDGSILVVDDQDTIYKFDKDGNEVFVKVMDSRLNGKPSVGKDGTIYQPSEDNNLYAFNPDGSEKWVYSSRDQLRNAPVESSDGSLYMSTFGGKSVIKLVPDGDGVREEWSFDTGEVMEPPPTVSEDGKTIYVSGFDGTLYALDPDKNVTWKEKFDWRLTNPLTISPDGSVYGAFLDGKIYRFSTEKEQLQDTAQLQAQTQQEAQAGKPDPVTVNDQWVIIDGVKIPVNND